MNSHDEYKVVIASHVYAFGTSQALHEYYKRKNVNVEFIAHKLMGNVITWFIGAIHTFFKVAIAKGKYDLYIGSNNLNAFVGLMCKNFGFVKKVVYFSPDFSYERFSLRILNRIYHWIDIYCVKNADKVWNSSAIMDMDPMMHEREINGLDVRYRLKQIQVPDGTDDKKILSEHEIDNNLIGFVGHVRDGMGVENLLEAFKIVKQKKSDAKLLIIGDGPNQENVEAIAKEISDVELTGYMGDIDAVYNRLAKCCISVAPYEEGSITYYTDPGKVKVYWSVGLPVVITDVPKVAKEVEASGCGIVVQAGNIELLADALVRLLTDYDLLTVCREKVIDMKQQYSWDNIFNRALELSGE